eukprot:TRINITY_DN445_c0_g1_i1.p1 TRINITY_DN445_c0_g1~~TRINITY_DN445_c0_g1_i1.p1  ORF type:complete len:451 (-),score=110.55 TRINITY_DN445_c0_g1_i1:1700-3052(-)
MGRWKNFWQRHDPDNVFAYKTAKLVKIRDRRLGFLHMFFIVCIIGYIVFYALLIKKGFLVYQTPAGSVDMWLTPVKTFPDPSTLSYCKGTEGCLYMDNLDVGYPSGTGKTLLATTYMEQYVQDAADFGKDNGFVEDVRKESRSDFLIGVEEFTLNIVHRAISYVADIVGEADSMEGTLQKVRCEFCYKETDWEDTDITFKKGTAILKLPLSELLDSSKFDLDEIVSGSETGRRRGVILLLLFQYENSDIFSLDTVYYKIRPIVLDPSDTEYKMYETLYLDYNVSTGARTRVVRNRHGIRIVAIQGGQLGGFRFIALLIQLTTSIALLKVATTIVDIVALYVMPDKKHYREYKYEKTEDFSDLRDHIEKEEKKKDELKVRRQNIFSGRSRVGLGTRPGGKDGDDIEMEPISPSEGEVRNPLGGSSTTSTSASASASTSKGGKKGPTGSTRV